MKNSTTTIEKTETKRKGTSLGIGAVLKASANLGDATNWVDTDTALELTVIGERLLELYYELNDNECDSDTLLVSNG